MDVGQHEGEHVHNPSLELRQACLPRAADPRLPRYLPILGPAGMEPSGEVHHRSGGHHAGSHFLPSPPFLIPVLILRVGAVVQELMLLQPLDKPGLNTPG